MSVDRELSKRLLAKVTQEEIGGDPMESEGMVYLINGVLSLAALALFYRSRKTAWKVSLAVVAVVFLLPLFLYAEEGKLSDDVPYFLGVMLAGLGAGTELLLVGWLKGRRAQAG